MASNQGDDSGSKPPSAAELYGRAGDNPLTKHGGSSEGLEPGSEHACYGVRAGNQGVAMLDVRFMGGDRRALGYSFLVDVQFDRSGTITATFTGHTLTIEGRHLEVVYVALSEMRLWWVKPAPHLADMTDEVPDGEPFIERLAVEATGR